MYLNISASSMIVYVSGDKSLVHFPTQYSTDYNTTSLVCFILFCFCFPVFPIWKLWLSSGCKRNPLVCVRYKRFLIYILFHFYSIYYTRSTFEGPTGVLFTSCLALHVPFWSRKADVSPRIWWLVKTKSSNLVPIFT